MRREQKKIISCAFLIFALIPFMGNTHDSSSAQTLKNISNDLLFLEAELVIGDKNISTDNEIQSISSIAVDASGRLYIVDLKAGDVKVFDKSGALVKVLGRAGQGPGEFELPARIRILGNGDIYVISMGKITIFDRTWEFKNQLNVAGKFYETSAEIDSEGNIIATRIEKGDNIVDIISKYDQNLNKIADFASVERSFSVSGKRDAFPVQLLFAVSQSDDSIIWGYSKEYVLHIESAAGHKTDIVKKDYIPVKFKAEDRDDFISERKTFTKEQIARYLFPEYFPYFRHLSTDKAGRILVWTYEKDPERRRVFDIFKKDGKYVGKIMLPFFPTCWKDGYLYAVGETPEGFQFVTRYKATWRDN